MINISKISVNIKGDDNKNYGFEYEFSERLNILTGSNSSGKSTILSCVYYCLGMEQLLSGSIKNSLDKCLYDHFYINEEKITIKKSKAILIITNGLDIAEISRDISLSNNNIIYIKINNNDESKKKLFLHKINDHSSEKAFYSWLKEFCKIEIPTITSKDGKEKKQLYLQNIFSSVLIEQTKGWSDFFAQMPYFSITEPKRKLQQYLLDLKSLRTSYEKEILIHEKKSLIDKWDSHFKLLNKEVEINNFKIDYIDDKLKLSINLNDIRNSILKISINNEFITLSEYIDRLNNELTNINKNNDEKKLSLLTQYQSDEIEIRIKKYKSLKKIQERANNEILKVSDYENNIKKINIEINRITELKELDSLNLYNKEIDIHFCPLCDTDLTNDSQSKLSTFENNYERSLSYLKSQKNLYQDYINKSKLLLSTYSDTTSYFKKLINESNSKLESLEQDICSTNDISRYIIETEIRNKIKIEQALNLNELFNIEKEKLLLLYSVFRNNAESLKLIESNNAGDLIKIKKFRKRFIKFLSLLNYTSNSSGSIIIKDEKPSYLIPFIELKKNNYQAIKNSSSASDFIRVLQAFYLSLTYSEKHPGLLIIDEPGQHSMSTDSLKSLLKLSSKKRNTQFIFAISKDIIDKERNIINIDELTSEINHKNLKIIKIDSEKCIQEVP